MTSQTKRKKSSEYQRSTHYFPYKPVYEAFAQRYPIRTVGQREVHYKPLEGSPLAYSQYFIKIVSTDVSAYFFKIEDHFFLFLVYYFF